MNWINIQTKLLKEDEFLHASREQIGSWLLLMGYCHEQENNGVIRNAASWPPATWMRIIGSDTPGDSCPLWTWRGDDLILFAFDREKQFEVERRRVAAKKARQKRWPSDARKSE